MFSTWCIQVGQGWLAECHLDGLAQKYLETNDSCGYDFDWLAICTVEIISIGWCSARLGQSPYTTHNSQRSSSCGSNQKHIWWMALWHPIDLPDDYITVARIWVCPLNTIYHTASHTTSKWTSLYIDMKLGATLEERSELHLLVHSNDHSWRCSEQVGSYVNLSIDVSTDSEPSIIQSLHTLRAFN